MTSPGVAVAAWSAMLLAVACGSDEAPANGLTAAGGASGTSGSGSGGTWGTSPGGTGGAGAGGATLGIAGAAPHDGPSCADLAATCGPSGNESCCTSIEVPQGTTPLSGLTSDPPASVSAFRLDKYEVTVGRLRVFVSAGLGTQLRPPDAG